jgi:UDP-GlcNAc:undecaprenyl-phosphate GlcNAc-1-phosphate transferase
LGLCGTVIFLLGVYDDIKGATYKKKLAVQIPSSVILYFLGFKISIITLPWGGSLPLGILAFPLTILWLLLICNGLNLIDGRDGLASGMVIFSSFTLAVASFILGHPVIAFLFTAIAGASLGFLPYNFPPATIYMGDSGSLFLGFTMAALAIKGSMKGTTGVALVIPMVALGLVITDTLLAAVRRFAVGKPFYVADKDHIHHRIDGIFGHNSIRSLMIQYAFSLFFCVLAIILIFAGKEITFLTLLVTAVGIGVLLHKLGYIRFIRDDGILMAFKHWMVLNKSKKMMQHTENVDELWDLLTTTVHNLGFNKAKIELANKIGENNSSKKSVFFHRSWEAEGKKRNGGKNQILNLPISGRGAYTGSLMLERNSNNARASVAYSFMVEALRKNLINRLDNLQSHRGLMIK